MAISGESSFPRSLPNQTDSLVQALGLSLSQAPPSLVMGLSSATQVSLFGLAVWLVCQGSLLLLAILFSLLGLGSAACSSRLSVAYGPALFAVYSYSPVPLGSYSPKQPPPAYLQVCLMVASWSISS